MNAQDFTIDLEGELTVFYQICKEIVDRIESGTLSLGEAMPDEKEMTKEHNISTVWVHATYQDLEAYNILNYDVPNNCYVVSGSANEHLLEWKHFWEQTSITKERM